MGHTVDALFAATSCSGCLCPEIPPPATRDQVNRERSEIQHLQLLKRWGSYRLQSQETGELELVEGYPPAKNRTDDDETDQRSSTRGGDSR